MLTIEPDCDRFVETHKPHHFHAQARGFALIRDIERYLDEADSYAGRYTGYIDPMTEDLVITGECGEEYEAAMNNAREVACMVTRSNGYRILLAQRRSDDAAILVYQAHGDLDPPA